MATDDLVEMAGIVTDVHPGGVFEVTLENERKIQAYLGGKLRQHKIRVVLGDAVTVGITPYDLTKGRIMFRHK
jgi:translation initiation factor IF-1